MTTEEPVRPLNPAPLICVFGDDLKQSTPMPPDGLCDHVFFDSMQKEGGNQLGRQYDEGFQRFVSAAAEYSSSEFGVGFDYTSWPKMHAVAEKPETASELHFLCEKRICHFGFLNTHLYNFNSQDLKGMVLVLKKISAHMDIMRSATQSSHMVLATSFPESGWEAYHLRLFRETFMPDIVILLATLSADDSGSPHCLTLPANFLYVPPSPAYFFSIETALMAIKELQSGGSASVMALSLALSGRWYAPAYPDPDVKDRPGNFSLLQSCTEIPQRQMASVVEVCKSESYPSKIYDEQQQAMYVYNKTLLRMFIYDSEQTLRYKVCTSKSQMTDNKYGLALFRMEHADGSNVCGEGTYPRVRAMREALNFLTNEFHSPDAAEECMKKTEPSTTTEVVSTTTVLREPSTVIAATADQTRSAPLICTLSDRMNASMAFPEDGLCDYILFDSLEKKDGNTIAGPPKENFQHFLDMATKHQKTQYGVGFDYESSQEVEKIIGSPETKAHLNVLWQQKIFHYGVLNTDVYEYTTANLSCLLRLLQKVSVFLKEKRTSKQPAYTMLAAGFASSQFTSEAISRMKAIYTPDIVIAVSHLFNEDKEFPECRIVPPTSRFVAPAKSYFYSLETAHEALGQLQAKGLNFVGVVSVAMFGRWYKPRRPDPQVTNRPGSYAPLQPCASIPEFQLDTITKVCKNPSYTLKIYAKGIQAEYVYNKTAERTFIYDIQESLAFKLCQNKRSWIPLKYGLVAYNLEYSDGANFCGRGAFPTLLTMKKFLRFIEHNFTSIEHFEACVRETQPPPYPTTISSDATEKSFAPGATTILAVSTNPSSEGTASPFITQESAEMREPTSEGTTSSRKDGPSSSRERTSSPVITQQSAGTRAPASDVTLTNRSAPAEGSKSTIFETSATTVSTLPAETTDFGSEKTGPQAFTESPGSGTSSAKASAAEGSASSILETSATTVSAVATETPHSSSEKTGPKAFTESPGPGALSANTTDHTASTELMTDATTPQPKAAAPLICTFGQLMNTSTPFPPDGMCDLVFYTAVGSDSSGGLLSTLDDKLDYFMEAAMTEERTEYGLGLDFYRLEAHKQLLERPDAAPSLEHFIKRGISGFGYLNTKVYQFAKKDLLSMLYNLKKISELVAPRRSSSNPIYTVLAMGLPTSGWTKMSAKLLTKIFKPDILVSISHLFDEDKHLQDCTILPPTFLFQPYAKSYAHSLISALQSAKELRQRMPNLTITISVGMFGRFYRPRYPDPPGAVEGDGNYTLLQECDYIPEYQLASVVDMCNNRKYMEGFWDNKIFAMVRYNKKLQRLFVHDDHMALLKKLCLAKKSFFNIKFGVTAYGLEFADVRGDCTGVPFVRIKVLRDMMRSFAHIYASSASVGECDLETPQPASETETLVRAPLICVLRDQFQTPMNLPEPHVCDYIYYDPVEQKADGENILTEQISMNLRYFLLQVLYRSSATDYGVGLNYEHVQKTLDLLRTERHRATLLLHRLWNMGINHFAYLNTPAVRYDMIGLHRVLSSLKVVKEIMQVKETSGLMPKTTVATILPDDAWLQAAQALLKQVYRPDHFIVISHYADEDKQYEDCLIVPPSFHLKPPSDVYISDMDTAFANAAALKKSAEQMLVLVSVTMVGRWYMPLLGRPDIVEDVGRNLFLQPCDYIQEPQIGHVNQVCKNSDYRSYHDDSIPGDIAYNPAVQRAFTYTDDLSLRQQLCTNGLTHRSAQHGIAVYHIEHDDVGNFCGKGEYHRLRTVREVTSFLRSRRGLAATQANIDQCISRSNISEAVIGGDMSADIGVPTEDPFADDNTLDFVVIDGTNSTPSSPLICVFRHTIKNVMSLPPYDLCDIVFLDSMEKGPEDTMITGLHSESFKYFAGYAEKRSRRNSSYGIGLNFDRLRKTEQLISYDALKTKKLLRWFYIRGMSHYAFLNAPLGSYGVYMFKRMLIVLKTLQDFLQPMANLKIRTTLATTVQRGQWLEEAKTIMTTVHKPDHFIVVSHYDISDARRPDCLIVPPVLRFKPPSGAYEYSLANAQEDAESILEDISNITVSVSVTMIGRWYKPKNPDPREADDPGHYSFLQPCGFINQHQIGNISEVCRNSAYKLYHNHSLPGDMAYSKSVGNLLTFNDDTSLREEGRTQHRDLTATRLSD